MLNLKTPVALACILILSTCTAVAQAYPPPDDALTRIHYDFEIAAYCGLIDERVSTGFQRQLAALLATLTPDREILEQARSDAWQAAYEEWQNRGLGGFRAWCRNEGRAVVARFTAP